MKSVGLYCFAAVVAGVVVVSHEVSDEAPDSDPFADAFPCFSISDEELVEVATN
jgi:hypothetical protein